MASSMKDVLAGIPGLTHWYPLNDTYGPNDNQKGLNGQVHGNIVFDDHTAQFDGKSWVELPDHNDFSAATTGAITVLSFLTITNWKGAGATEYIHWLGKGKSGAHEWTFRHYVDGGTGEAPTRQGRVSFYCFNADGGLGAGSYFQDSEDTVERMVVGQIDRTNTYMWKDAVLRDSDALSGYNITPTNTGSVVGLGSRGDNTGFLVGKLRNVMFFNRKLSQAEIKTIFDARDLPINPTVTPTPTPPPNPGAAYITTDTTDVAGKHNALVNKLVDLGVLK